MDRTETRHLPVKLTQKEVLVKSKLAAKGMAELNRLEDEKADVTKKLGDKIKDKRRELNALAHEVDTGTEVRPVECDLVPRWGDFMMDVVRSDTGEVVDSRPMTHSERQQRLQFQQQSHSEEREADEPSSH